MRLHDSEYLCIIKNVVEAGQVNKKKIYQLTDVKFYSMMPASPGNNQLSDFEMGNAPTYSLI